MAGRSISVPTNFIIIGTDGRLPVPNASLRRLVSALKLAPTYVAVISESSHAPKSFLMAVTHINPLWLFYDWYGPTNLNKEFDHRCHCDAPVKTMPLFTVLQYLKQYTRSFDFRCFRVMWIEGNKLQEREHFGEHRDMDVLRWAKHWKHWSIVTLSAVLVLARERFFVQDILKKWIPRVDWSCW